VAEVMVKIDHNRVTITGTLTMGRCPQAVLQVWERRRGPGKGWTLVTGPREFIEHEDALGLELAELLDGLPLPFAVANMLPRPATPATAAAIAEAAKEVGRA
jgi:hypothetical protein